MKDPDKDREEKEAAQARRFRRLISIDIRHEYCNRSADKGYGGIEIVPTPCTVQRLSRYGFLARRRSDGLDILHSGAHAAAFGGFLRDLRKWAPGGLPSNIQNKLFWPPLLFTLSLTDPLFFNFTDAPTDARAGKPALWLSNWHGKAIRDEESEGRPIVPQTARIEVDWSGTLIRQKAAKPKKADERDSAPAVVEPPASAAEKARDFWDEAQPDAEARAEAGTAADPFDQWWFESAADNEEARRERLDMRAGLRPRPLPLGFFEIHLQPASGTRRRAADAWYGFPLDFDPPEHFPDGATFDADGFVRPSRYEIRFEARKTRWRYLVAGRGRELEESKFLITDGDGGKSFEPTGRSVLPNGASALRFEIPEPISLTQKPERLFALEGVPAAGNPRPRKLIDPLPAPSADLILPDPHPPPAAGATAWSEVYIFV